MFSNASAERLVVHTLIVGGSREERLRAAHAVVAAGGSTTAQFVEFIAATSLPFVTPIKSTLPLVATGQPPQRRPPRSIRIDDVEGAFPNEQAGTRLILTQSTYTLQKWLDLLEGGDRMVLTGDRETLEVHAPEAFQGRGPWRFFGTINLDESPGELTADTRPGVPDQVEIASVPQAMERLVRAYLSPSSEERFALCREAANAAPTSPIVALALASACREQQDMAGARAALDLAMRLAPDWEAVHYETGKFWLSLDEMERAQAAFERACELMPTFAAAFSNLGATLGELDRPAAALAAFEHAATADPDNFMILNNIGVVTRELGRLEESESVLRRLVEHHPEFIFGHYNLGHTLFLGGKYPDALTAYEEGQRRDPQKNRRQGCRLALARFANHDVEGAERDLEEFTTEVLAEEREDLLLEAYEVARALIQDKQELAGQHAFLEWIAARLRG